MAASITLTEVQTITALRTVLLGVLAPEVEIVKAQTNRVPEPLATDFLVLTPLLRARLSANVDTFTDEPTATPPIARRNSLVPTQLTVQIDIHGPSSADNAQIISTVLRDEYATKAFEATGVEVQTLYAEDPRQMPFLNGEQQIEWRWTVDAVLQVNPVVRTPQDFADVVEATLIEVDGS